MNAGLERTSLSRNGQTLVISANDDGQLNRTCLTLARLCRAKSVSSNAKANTDTTCEARLFRTKQAPPYEDIFALAAASSSISSRCGI